METGWVGWREGGGRRQGHRDRYVETERERVRQTDRDRKTGT